MSKLDPVDFVEAIEQAVSQTEPKTSDQVKHASKIIQRVIHDNDVNRMMAATQLINTFNYAIQVQANRQQWEPRDYQSFCIALAALDQISE